MKKHPSHLVSRIWRYAFILMALITLNGCGGGGGTNNPPTPVPVPDADPTGYYTNTGTLSLLSITDLQAMFYQGHVTLFSQAQGYGFIGTYTVSGNTISGDLREYKESDQGSKSDTGTFTATFNPTDHSITGTLNTKAGVTNASFTLNYASGRSNSTVTAIVKNGWNGIILNNTKDVLTVNIADNTKGAAALTTQTAINDFIGNFDSCDFSGTLTPVTGSLYSVSISLSGCSSAINSTAYTGLAALNGSTLFITVDDNVTFAVNTGIFGVFN
ncbi:MAG: hypothetical protein GC149_03130 [Gammaproteobacteria bacterium]|nr:hypothetical protein [Gammaproteobacteria bacterium]